jgi:hypothetical protein
VVCRGDLLAHPVVGVNGRSRRLHRRRGGRKPRDRWIRLRSDIHLLDEDIFDRVQHGYSRVIDPA